MHLTKKIKINLSNEQIDVLWEMSEQCRLLYNFSLDERNNAWHTEKRIVTYTEKQNKLPDIKKKHPNYNIVYSKVLQMTLKKLDANFSSFLALRKSGNTDAKPPGFKGKKYLMTLCYNQSGFKIKNDVITFSHKVKGVPLTFFVGNELENLDIKQIEIYNEDP